MRALRFFVAALLLLVTPVISAQHVRPVGPMDAAEIKLALDKLDVLASALYVAAHPDDENTAMLAWLANGRLAEAAYLSLTRGSGGQNLIGTETGDLLGVIRTEELLAARAIDRGEQRFTRGIDFGYTKSPEETLSIWDENEVLSDVVRVIRERRPDVILTRFPADGGGGHGQHSASAILAERAFELAGDPDAFPEQLESLRPWKPRRLFWNAWGDSASDAPVVTVDLGEYNRLLGLSYAEISALSRSMHKSQGFGVSARRGSLENSFRLVKGDAPASNDVFAGIDTTWARVGRSGFVAALIEKARESYDVDQPDAILPILLELWDQMDQLAAGADDVWWVSRKQAELQDIIASVNGLWIEAIAANPTAAPGSTLPVTITVVRRGGTSGALVDVDSDWVDRTTAVKPLVENQPAIVQIEIPISSDAKPSQPYWLRLENDGRMHRIEDSSLVTLPVGPPSIPVQVHLSIDGRDMTWNVPVLYRWTDPVHGELYRELEIVPPVTLSIQPPLLAFPSHEPRRANVILEAAEEVRGSLAFDVPLGWSVKADTGAIELSGGERREIPIVITPPEETSSVAIVARLNRDDGRSWSLARRSIDYDHIPKQSVFGPAAIKAVHGDIAIRGSRVGYVMGSGDEVPEALRQIGYEVTDLGPEQLTPANLAQFDAIVFGIRAFNTIENLAARMEPVIEYVERGGVVVVQYNTQGRREETIVPAPSPFSISRDRVTVESAPVEVIDPEHPLFNVPNDLSSEDFDGWIQERGLYFAGDWEPKWQAVLSMADPGEDPVKGSLLYTEHGEGVFIYTGLSFFRQLPAGVPGAYRLFANLVSGGKAK